MNQLVLSGTALLVPSGTGSSCYRGPESGSSPCFAVFFSLRNFTNRKSFGFLLTESATSRAWCERQRYPEGRANVRKPGTPMHAALGECTADGAGLALRGSTA